MYTYIYIYMYICVYIYTYICIYVNLVHASHVRKANDF